MININEMPNSKMAYVAKKLLDNRDNDRIDWPWLSPERSPSLKEVNKFFLGSILDYQIPAYKAWDNARRLSEDILNDPELVLWSPEIISRPSWFYRV